MSQRTVARRYASALYEQARADDVLDAVDDDVEMLRRSFDDNLELERLFTSPAIPRSKKDDVVKALLSDKVNALTLRFIRLLIHKDRETVVQPILDQYHALRDEQRGIVDVHATVAQPLSDADEKAVRTAMETHTGKTVRLHVRENPDLIGGIVLRVGDRVFDGSVRNKLSSLRDRLRADRSAAPATGTGATGNGAA